MSSTHERDTLSGTEAAEACPPAFGELPAAPAADERGDRAEVTGAWASTPVSVPSGAARVAHEVASDERVLPSACGCASCRGAASAPPRLVYALGALGFDYGIEARRDSIKQHMSTMAHPTKKGQDWGDEANPHDPDHLLHYLDQHHWDAASIVWTLNIETLPIYAIAPHGPFAGDCCSRLRQYLTEQVKEGVERVSIAGIINGSVRLFNGLSVPVIVPELRGMHNWHTGGLVKATLGPAPAADAPAAKREVHEKKEKGLRNFLERAYHELRNRGVAPHERAINYAATQTFDVGNVYKSLEHPMELDRIEAEPSPICRHESECWDVKLYFFNPESHVHTVRKVYRLTVDVSDVVPVTVGRTREWFVR